MTCTRHNARSAAVFMPDGEPRRYRAFARRGTARYLESPHSGRAIFTARAIPSGREQGASDDRPFTDDDWRRIKSPVASLGGVTGTAAGSPGSRRRCCCGRRADARRIIPVAEAPPPRGDGLYGAKFARQAAQHGRARRLDRRRVRRAPPARDARRAARHRRLPPAAPAGPAAPARPWSARCRPGCRTRWTPRWSTTRTSRSSSSAATTSPHAPAAPPPCATWATRSGELRAAGCEVVVGTCPDLGAIRPIKPPLRWLARRWSRQLAAAQTVAVVEAGGRTVSLGDLLGPAFEADPDRMFGADRFHPSAEGYARARRRDAADRCWRRSARTTGPPCRRRASAACRRPRTRRSARPAPRSAGQPDVARPRTDGRGRPLGAAAAARRGSASVATAGAVRVRLRDSRRLNPEDSTDDRTGAGGREMTSLAGRIGKATATTLLAGTVGGARCSPARRSPPSAPAVRQADHGPRPAHVDGAQLGAPVLRLVLLGDSAALGVGVEWLSETVGGQLARLLAEGRRDRRRQSAVQRRRRRLALVRPGHPGGPGAARRPAGRGGDPDRRERRHHAAQPGRGRGAPRRGRPPAARGRRRRSSSAPAPTWARCARSRRRCASSPAGAAGGWPGRRPRPSSEAGGVVVDLGERDRRRVPGRRGHALPRRLPPVGRRLPGAGRTRCYPAVAGGAAARSAAASSDEWHLGVRRAATVTGELTWRLTASHRKPSSSPPPAPRSAGPSRDRCATCAPTTSPPPSSTPRWTRCRSSTAPLSTTSTSAAACPAASRASTWPAWSPPCSATTACPARPSPGTARRRCRPPGWRSTRSRPARATCSSRPASRCVSRYARGSSDGLPPEAQALVGGGWQNPRFADARARTATRARRAAADLARPARGRRAARRLPRDGPDRGEPRPDRGTSPARTWTSSAYAVQNLAEKAIADGFWAREITPVTLPDGTVVSHRRRPPAGRDPRGGGRAQAGVPPRRPGHRRQLLPAQRRRRRGGRS